MPAINRFDPYKNFKFVVKFGPKIVAGISKVGGLKKTTEVVKHREGADPSTSRKSPGRTEFEAITLERGVTGDPEFEKWANQVWFFQAQAPGESALGNFRRALKTNREEKLAAKHTGYRKRYNFLRGIAKDHCRLLIDVDHLIHGGFPARGRQSLSIEINDGVLVRGRKG